jgi:hypothetical protein
MNEIIDFSDLNELYVVQKMNTKDISEIKGCHSSTIRRHLQKLNIPLRSEVIDWSDLEQLYVTKKLSLDEIAKIKGTQRRIVRSHLKKAGIPRRDKSQGQLASWRGKSRKKRDSLKGENSPSWNGGKNYTDKVGYVKVYCPNHPYAHNNRVYEHRLVMEKKLGRYLKPWEVVHHLGTKFPISSIENKSDNREENLELKADKLDHLPSILMVRTLNKLEKEVVYLREKNQNNKAVIKELKSALQGKLGQVQLEVIGE